MTKRKSVSRKMSEEARLKKNDQIKKTRNETIARRSSMIPKTYDLKIVNNSLNKAQRESLRAVFLEKKWIRNAAIGAERFDDDFLTELDGIVPVKLPDGEIEDRELSHIGSQMAQSVMKELRTNLSSLSSHKKKNRKVGKLKFVRNVNSITLKQYGSTHRFYSNENGKITKVKIQNIPGKMRIRGFSQIPDDTKEFSSANLIKKADGYHILLTVFVNREEPIEKIEEMGVDFGVKSPFVLSDGTIVSGIVEEQESLRKLHRKLSRQQKDSNGYNRTKEKIQMEYLRASRKKDDLANKLVHEWTKDKIVYFQDENISSWKKRDSGSRGSKKIHNGILGRVKSRLRNKEDTIMLPRWVATTAWCPQCGNKTPHSLDKRIYVCSFCDYSEDRDIHSAKNMIILGKRYKQLYTSGTEGSADGGNVRLREKLYELDSEQLSMKSEAVKSSVSS